MMMIDDLYDRLMNGFNVQQCNYLVPLAGTKEIQELIDTVHIEYPDVLWAMFNMFECSENLRKLQLLAKLFGVLAHAHASMYRYNFLVFPFHKQPIECLQSCLGH
jgi:hypothetical protein